MNNSFGHPLRRRRWDLFGRVGLWMGAVLLVTACAAPLAPPIRSAEPIGVQLMRVDSMFIGAPFRVLLDFESPSDLAFVSGAGNARMMLDPQVAHTGLASLQLPETEGPRTFTVKLNSLLPPSNFPNGWTLAGAYFISRESAKVDVSYEVNGKPVLHRSATLEPRRWVPVFVDLTSLSDPNSSVPATEVGVLKFTLSGPAVWCDDVLVFDNNLLLTPESEKAGETWSVRRRGLSTLIENPGSFKLTVPTPEADPNGWRVEEANDLRVRLASANGRRFFTIYSDGREYQDGKFASALELPADQMALLEAQQASPAELSVPDDLGRVERNAPGDRNNDGYAESTGAYQVKANGPRLEVTITPRTAKLVRPVVEIAGLPAGHVIGNLEGRLIEKTVRLANGHVLMEVPGTVNRPVTLNVRVQ